ncbi:MAG TPA: DUF2314 domain-containing protein [Hyphomonadaceae bacterium]|nr:DUF2314 domain-containing protein [Hyphomonadaceae bacterium]
MKLLKTLLVAATFLAPASPAALAQQGKGDPVVDFSSSDKEMNAAIADARAHLPYFWQRQASPARTESDFGLKVAFPVKGEQGETREHIWVSDVHRTAGGYAGKLANEPDWMPGKHLGDQVAFSDDMISDWGFYRDDMMIGFYTIRVMIRTLEPAEAARIRDHLGDNPR